MIGAPSPGCPTGSSIEYSIDGGSSFSSTLPAYDQENPITVITRCSCTFDSSVQSPTTSVTTNPGNCPPCPELSEIAPAIEISSESSCIIFGSSPAGGSFSAPSPGCPSGSTIEYSTDGGSTFSTMLPSYDQNNSITVLTRCSCVADPTIFSPSNSATTSPGSCPECPDLNAAAPAVQIVAESSCDVFQGTPSGGSLAAPAASCPTGSTLEYSTDGGTTFSTILPTYDQFNSISVITRCNCDAIPSQSSPLTTITTNPVACPDCPILDIAPPPIVIDSESSCLLPGSTPTGGLLSAPTNACPTGSTLQFKVGSAPFSTDLPVYDQENSLSILTRCNCDGDPSVSSPTASISTSPGSCPECPDLSDPAPAVVIDSESSCSIFNGTPSGGLLSEPVSSCPTGSNLEYSTDGGSSFSSILPSYDQINSITVITRCSCEGENIITSPETSITTNPGSCPECNIVMSCDDGDPCTTNDVQTMDSNGNICVPCMGSLDTSSCDPSCTTTQPCDDGDPDTENDIEVIALDGSICTPCQGQVPLDACVDDNFEDAPTGLFVDQSSGSSTRLLWDHYSDASDGCIIRGGTIESLDPSAAFTQNPGNVLVQGTNINGLPNGFDNSAALGPNSPYELFNVNTFPNGNIGFMVPGAFYKWKVRCGCVIDPSLPLPDRLLASNVHLSPWSEYNMFTNLMLPIQNPESEGGFEDYKSLETENFSIYPNPFNDEINIHISTLESDVNLFVINALGKVVHEERIRKTSDANTQIINTSHLERGIYFLLIEGENGLWKERIVKQ